jgi:hypothetical protein
VSDVIHVFAQVVVSANDSDEVKTTTIGKAVSHFRSVYGQQLQPKIKGTFLVTLYTTPTIHKHMASYKNLVC